MSAVRGALGAWLLTCLGAAACGDDAISPSLMLGGLDAGLQDGGSSTMDARIESHGDAMTPSDAQTALVRDAGPTCTIAADDTSIVASHYLSADDPIAVSVRNDGATLLWVAYADNKRRLYTSWFGASDSTSTPPPADDSTQIEPASSATSTGFLAVWSDDLNGAFDLRAQRTDSNGVLLDLEPIPLTHDAADNHNPALASGMDGKAVVVWQTRQPSARGKAMLLGADGKAAGEAHEIPDFAASASRPAVAQLGVGYVVAWVDQSARHVHVQRLDAAGVPVGASSQVDAEGIAHGNLDLATSDKGGAVVFDVLVDGRRPEIRLRTFDANALPTGSELIVSKSPDQGLIPSIISLRGGFALAYRSAQTSEPQLRLALLDGLGAPIVTAQVATLASIDLPLFLRASADGTRLFLGWIDQDSARSGYQLQRAWIHCD